MMRTFPARAVLFAALGLAACDPNSSGNTGATKTGDTSHPAQRGSPIEALRAACGDGAPTEAGAVLHRQPYLQQVTATSAQIGWVSVAPDGELVSVSEFPLRSAPVTTPARIEATAVREAGENQMWTQLDSLSAKTVYCYQPSDGAAPLNNATGFRTAPAADDPDPVRFLAFGDSGGGGPDQYALLEQMYQFPFDLMIHTGDVAYDNGTIAQFEDNVFGVYAELFRNLPFYPAAGNHEYGTMQGAPFRDVFSIPAGGGEKWYSFDYGRVHFAALDTEEDYATQMAWLDADLAASAAPWKVVFMHRPPYSSGYHGSDLPLRELLAPVVEKHHVQLVLAGHDHSYERVVPQNGVAYVVTGGGGKGTYGIGTSDFTGFSLSVIHFVYAEVGIDEMVLHAVDADGVEFDSMVIPR
jgi:acid phosphatase type 7